MTSLVSNRHGKLIYRGKSWVIIFHDKRVKKELSIELKAKNHEEAIYLFEWWSGDDIQKYTIPFPWPFSAISVRVAMNEYLSSPEFRRVSKSRDLEDIRKRIDKYFGGSCFQEINARQCREYAEFRRQELVSDMISEQSLQWAYRQIRKELNFLLNVASYARRWQRVLESELPDISLDVIFGGLTYRNMLTTIPLERTPKFGPWAKVQDMMVRRMIQTCRAAKDG
ncbi:hypothetical protein OIU35_15125 [Boseaceae bacterium BT-24-1]|nr:hypothetical protein [Boseaceae bacterium BT-24-1]